MDFKDLLDKWERSEEGKAQSRFQQQYAERRDQEESTTELLSVTALKKMPPAAELDLHGFTADEAAKQVRAFLKRSSLQGLKKVQIVHGKGNHSANGPILKKLVKECIERSPYAGRTGTPPASEGGSGAVWVALKNKRR